MAKEKLELTEHPPWCWAILLVMPVVLMSSSSPNGESRIPTLGYGDAKHMTPDRQPDRTVRLASASITGAHSFREKDTAHHAGTHRTSTQEQRESLGLREAGFER